MGLSRTAKILLAALLVAAAGFAWVNYFNQNPLVDAGGSSPITTAPVSGAPVTVAPLAGDTAAATATAPASESDASVADSPAGVDGAVTAGTDPDAPAEATDVSGAGDETPGVSAETVPTSEGTVVAESPASDASAPPVVVTQAPSVVTRDLVVGDLPFLVTSPPIAEAGTDEDAAAGASRPQGAQRTSVNPFSPMIVQTPPAPAQPVLAQATPEVVEIVSATGSPPPATVITEVATPSSTATAAPPTPVAAPAPRTVAPATSASAALPRPLPSGTLPVTPEILREVRTPQEVAEAPAPVDLGALAAIRVPEEPEAQEPLPSTDSQAPEAAAAAATPEVLGTDRPNEPAAAATPETPTTPAPALPLAVGGDSLSRYLRDNNVRFTGTVLGPLSVGVFRSAQFSEPVVLTLGQTLPDTDIILSDLRGYEARFSLGESTQTLSLDLRR